MVLSRRQFIKCGVVAGGALHVGVGLNSRSVPGRAAIIGLGYAGMSHLNSVLSLDRVEIVAIADPLSERREAAVERLRACGRRTPLAENDGLRLIERARFDIAVVATPDCLHQGLIRSALDQGSHVMVEPLPTASLKEWDLLTAKFRSRRRTLQMAAPWRMDPKFQAFKTKLSTHQVSECSTRASICCAAQNPRRQASLMRTGAPISDALFPLLDALACVSGDLTPASCFATGSALGRRSSQLDTPRTLIGVIRTQEGMDISVQYNEVTRFDRWPGISTLSLAGRNEVLYQLEQTSRETYLTNVWTNFLLIARGEVPQSDTPETFRGAIALSHGLLHAYTSGRTVYFFV